MHAPLLAVLLLAPQSDDLFDLAGLASLRGGAVRTFTSDTSRASAARPDPSGTFPIAASRGGPGRVARLWLLGGDPRARLRLFSDDTVVPTLNERIGVAFEEGRRPLLSLSTFSPAKAAGARASYPSMPYRRETSVTVSSLGAAYEVELVEDEPPRMPPDPSSGPKTFELPLISLAPGETGILGEAVDSGTIRSLTISPDLMADEDLSAVSLRVFVDGETAPSIDAPLDLLFGSPTRTVRISTPGLRVSDRAMTLELPIPFSNGVRIEVANGAARPVRARGAVSVSRDLLTQSTGRLHVVVRRGEAREGAPYVVDEGDGAGRLIGLAVRFPAGAQARRGRVTAEADGTTVYRSVSLASAFDGGEAFGTTSYATVGAGASVAADKSFLAFALRVNRAIAFRRHFRQTVETAGEPMPLASASFVYFPPSLVRTVPRPPASAPAAPPDSAPAIAAAGAPESAPAIPAAIPPESAPAIPPESQPAIPPESAPASLPASAPAVAPSSRPAAPPPMAPMSFPTSKPKADPESAPASSPSGPPR